MEAKDGETIKEAITQARRDIIRPKEKSLILGRMGILSSRIHNTRDLAMSPMWVVRKRDKKMIPRF